MRVDIFTKSEAWRPYVLAVTKANALHIVAALERGGEHVGVFRHARVVGKIIYQTGEGWSTARR